MPMPIRTLATTRAGIFEGLRRMAVSAGCLLPPHEIMLESLKKNDNVLEKAKEERGAWAEGLSLKDTATEKADVIYRAGCLLSYEPELWRVARDAISLLQHAGVDVGISFFVEIN